MLATIQGWELQVERGPDCLLVKLVSPDAQNLETPHSPSLADELWALLERHFVYRMVLDLQDLEILHGRLLHELVILQERIQQHGGMLRLCGLSPENREVLAACELSDRFPVYPCRDDAMMSHLPLKPR